MNRCVVGKPSFIYHRGPYWLKRRGKPIQFGSAHITQTVGNRFRFATKQDLFMVLKSEVEYILKSHIPGNGSILWKNTAFKGEVIFPTPQWPQATLMGLRWLCPRQTFFVLRKFENCYNRGVENISILNFIFLVITYFAGILTVTTVTALSMLSFAAHKHFGRIKQMLISVLGTAGTVFLLKTIFNVPRPEGAFYIETTPSFPSGHAAIAMALYGFLFATIYKHDKHPLKNKTLLLLAILIILIGVSRLYLGVHYLSDVLVGYLIGFLWLAFALSRKS